MPWGFVSKFHKAALGKYDEADRRVILKSFYIILTSVAIYIAYSIYINSSEGYLKTIETILSSLLFVITTTMCFSIFERIGLLLPIQRRIQIIHKGLDIKFSRMQAAVVSSGEKADKDLKEAIESLQSYDKYRNCRLKFGFNDIAGLSIRRLEGYGNSDISRVDFLAQEIRRAGRYTVIYCMNTFIDNLDVIEPDVVDAIKRGVKINVLLMDPNIEHLTESRFEDAYKNTKHKDLKSFVEHVMSKSIGICQLREYVNNLPSSNHGFLDVRFYTKSLNFPMVSVYHERNGIKEEIVVYTGFYAGYSSEDMPYIEWRGGDFRAHEKFMEMFNKKWSLCHKNTDIRR